MPEIKTSNSRISLEIELILAELTTEANHLTDTLIIEAKRKWHKDIQKQQQLIL